MEERKDKREGLTTRLAKRYAQPSSKDMVILHGQASATVYGCSRILIYTPERISLKVGRQLLTLCGHELFCAAFTGGTVTVKGKILAVKYGEIKEKKEDGSQK